MIMAQKREGMQEFLRHHKYPFPLLSDERRQVVKEYGVYVAVNFESFNIARPGEFILDANGTIKFIDIGSMQTDFPPDEVIFDVIDDLKPGSPTKKAG